MIKPLNFDVAIRDQRSLPIKFCIQIGILLLAIVVNCSLLVNFRPKRLDETNIAIDATLVIFVHSALFLIKAAKVLLKIEKLILQCSVVSFSGA